MNGVLTNDMRYDTSRMRVRDVEGSFIVFIVAPEVASSVLRARMLPGRRE